MLEEESKREVDAASIAESSEDGSTTSNGALSALMSPQSIKSAAIYAVTGATTAATTAVTVVLPKFDPIPIRAFFIVSLCCAIPPVCFVIGFTKMGYGVAVYEFFSTHFEKHATIMAITVISYSFLLYLFDCQYWKSRFGKLARRSSVGIIIVVLATFILSIAGSHPYGPIGLLLFLTTLWLLILRNIFFSGILVKNYVSWLSGPLFLNSMVVAFAWLIWVFSGEENGWTIETKLVNARETGCEPNFEGLEKCRSNGTDVCFFPNGTSSLVFEDNVCDRECRDVYETCLNTFMIWSGPFMVSAGLLFLSFFSTFISGRNSAEQEMTRFSKVWIVLLFGVWVSASLAGAGQGLAYALAALTVSGFVASGVFLAYSFNKIEREEHLRKIWERVVENYSVFLDPMRGLLVLTCTPVAILYLMVSALKQYIRNLKCVKCARLPQPTDYAKEYLGILTVEARILISEFLSWNRVSVFTWSIYSGILIAVTAVASRFTTLFLSWLIEKTAGMSLYTVTGIMIGVGVTMFLLPPVPGMPIYLTMGIVIIPIGKEDLGVTWSILYACIISLLLKLFATFLQQKAIGGLLQNHVAVRQLCLINSSFIRSMKLLLDEKGLKPAKISILCGGPDWPTSVLCGIMGLPLLPVLIGTLPCFLLIVPTVLTGSFMYMSNEKEYPWAGVAATICGTIAALVLLGFMLLAAYYVEQALTTRKEEIDNIPYDEEVKKKEDAEKALNDAYEEVTKWNDVPFSMKVLIYMAVFFMIVFFYGVQLFQEECFAKYQLTDTIGKKLGGNWMNLIKPFGWIVLSLLVLSIILFLSFSSWAKRKAVKKCKDEESNLKEIPSEKSDDNIISGKDDNSVKEDDSVKEDVETSFMTTDTDDVLGNSFCTNFCGVKLK